MFPTNQIIFYRPADGSAARPAIVAGEDPSKTDGFHLHLVVFDPEKGPYLVRGVQGNNVGDQPGQWCWFPSDPNARGRALLGGGSDSRFNKIEEQQSMRQRAGVGSFRDHDEEIRTRINEARERGREQAKTLDEQVRADIQSDPVGYGDEKNIVDRDDTTAGERPDA